MGNKYDSQVEATEIVNKLAQFIFGLLSHGDSAVYVPPVFHKKVSSIRLLNKKFNVSMNRQE